jgi:hypothetical protein
VSFAALILCVASQRVFIVASVYFVIDSVRKLLDTLSYIRHLTISASDCVQIASFHVFMAGKIQVEDFWVMMPGNVALGYQHSP